jgi:hypothetical protein
MESCSLNWHGKYIVLYCDFWVFMKRRIGLTERNICYYEGLISRVNWIRITNLLLIMGKYSYLRFIQTLKSTENAIELIINILREYYVLLINCFAEEYLHGREKYFVILSRKCILKHMWNVSINNLLYNVEMRKERTLVSQRNPELRGRYQM